MADRVRQRPIPIWALLLAGLLPSLAAYVYFKQCQDATQVALLYSATKLFTVLWPWVCLFFWQRPSTPPRGCKVRSATWGLAFGLVAAAALAILYYGPLNGAAAQMAPQIAAKIRQLAIDKHYFAFSLFLSLIHSAIEEIYWRWFLYGHLRSRLGKGAGALLAASAFSAHHFIIVSEYADFTWILAGGAAVWVAGWLWCQLYERTGSLLGSWLSHVILDLAVMWIGWELLTAAPVP